MDQDLIKRYLEAKGQGVPDALNATANPDAAPVSDVNNYSSVGNGINLPTSTGVEDTVSPVDFTKQYPDLNRILSIGQPSNMGPGTPMPSTGAAPMQQPIAQASQEAGSDMFNALAKKAISKGGAQAAPAGDDGKDLSDASEGMNKEIAKQATDQTDTSKEDEDESKPEEKKSNLSLRELAVKQQEARRSASIMAGQIQGLNNVSAVTGRKVDTTGFQKQMENDLGDATDYQKQIDDQRNQQIADMHERASNISNEKALMQISNEKEMHNPESDISRAYQSLAGDIASRFNMDPTKFANVPASGIEKLMPGIDRIVQAQIRADYMKESLQSRTDAQKDKAEAKIANDQDKAYTQMRERMESFRGNRAAQQAALDTYSANKAFALVQDKDPNTLTTQDLSILAKELAKIATGGVPTEHGVKSLMPSNLRTKFAELQNFILSSPTDAQAGDYIRRNMEYLKGMNEEADKVVKTFRTNIAAGYKNRVRPEDYQEGLDAYQLGQQAPNQKQAPTAAPVKVRQKSTGAVKTLPASNAQKYLSDKDFEEVQ